jgi:hypothetical protein
MIGFGHRLVHMTTISGQCFMCETFLIMSKLILMQDQLILVYFFYKSCVQFLYATSFQNLF